MIYDQCTCPSDSDCCRPGRVYRLMYCICGVDCVPSHSDCCEPAVHWYSDLVQTHTEVTII